MSWSSISLPKQLIATGNLYTLSHVGGSPFLNVTVTSGDPAYAGMDSAIPLHLARVV